MHRQLASVLQRQGPEEAGEEIWRRWQEALIAAARQPEREGRIIELVSALAAVKVSAAGQPVGILFDPIPDEAASLGELVDAGRDALDPALTGLVEQLHHWSQRLRKPFRVVHDDSKVVRRWHELLLRFSSREIEPTAFDVGEFRFEYPLYGEEIETVDSRDCVAVQLADVLSGAVMWCLREQLRGAGVPPEWQRWDLGRFIDHFQGADDFLLGLVDPAGSQSRRYRSDPPDRVQPFTLLSESPNRRFVGRADSLREVPAAVKFISAGRCSALWKRGPCATLRPPGFRAPTYTLNPEIAWPHLTQGWQPPETRGLRCGALYDAAKHAPVTEGASALEA